MNHSKVKSQKSPPSQPSPLQKKSVAAGGGREAKSPISNLQSLFDPYFWLALLLSLPVISPLLQPGYFWGAHDARHSVYFLFEFDKGIQDGIWYPRWAPDFAFGFGYPFFNIYGPLSSYLGEVFHLLGADFVTAVKIVFGLTAVLAGVTMYLFVQDILGAQAGLVAALVYVYFPYHLFDLYVRAALAESVGFVFLPLVLWGFYRVMTTPSLKTIVLTAIAYAALMFTSNLLALLFTPILGLYVAVMLVFSPLALEGGGLGRGFSILFRRAIPPALALFGGLGLSAIFWLPAFLERQYVRVDQWIGGRYAFGDDFVDFFQLFSPRWGFGPSIPGPNDDAGFQIGLAALVLFALSFFAVPKLKNRALRVTLYFLQGLVLATAFLTTPLSAWVWRLIPLSSFAQFPWRLLVIIAPSIAVVAAAGVSSKFNLQRSKLGMILPVVLLILLASFPYVRAQVRDPKPTEGPVSLASLFRFQQSADELTGSTAWVKEIPRWSPLADLAIAGKPITTRVVQTEVWNETGNTPLMGVHSFEMDSVHEFVWVYAADDNQAVTFYIPYFPGWTATLYEDTNPENTDPNAFPYGRIGRVVSQPTISTTNPEGWMVVPVPQGSYFLELRFNDTPIRVVGKWLSLASLLVLAGGWIFGQRLKI